MRLSPAAFAKLTLALSAPSPAPLPPSPAPLPKPHHPPRSLPPPKSYAPKQSAATPVLTASQKERKAELLGKIDLERAIRTAEQNPTTSAAPVNFPVESIPETSPASLRERRWELQRQARQLLASAAKRESLVASAEASSAAHRDILQEIAGYDPNALQDPNRPVFRPKGGGRPDKTQRRHSQLQRAEFREGLEATVSGRERLAEWEQATKEIDRDLATKTNLPALSVANRYTHRPVPSPTDTLFVPACQLANIPEEERRILYGLPTLQEEIASQVKTHQDKDAFIPHRLYVTNRYIPLVTSIVLPETSWELQTTETPVPLPADASTFGPDSLEYQSLATVREFDIALRQLPWQERETAIASILEMNHA